MSECAVVDYGARRRALFAETVAEGASSALLMMQPATLTQPEKLLTVHTDNCRFGHSASKARGTAQKHLKRRGRRVDEQREIHQNGRTR